MFVFMCVVRMSMGAFVWFNVWLDVCGGVNMCSSDFVRYGLQLREKIWAFSDVRERNGKEANYYAIP